MSETNKIQGINLEKTKQQLEKELNEKKEIQERFSQQKSLLQNLREELITEQSSKADQEENLIAMEQRLIQAKGEWANAEHEKECLRCELNEKEDAVEELEKQLKEERAGGERSKSMMTTRTGTSKTDSVN